MPLRYSRGKSSKKRRNRRPDLRRLWLQHCGEVQATMTGFTLARRDAGLGVTQFPLLQSAGSWRMIGSSLGCSTRNRCRCTAAREGFVDVYA